jgi:hypothetical protein
VRDIGLRHAKDPSIALHALDHQECLITGDFGFAVIRNYPPENYHGIVVLELPRDATAADILKLVESFVQRAEIVSRLPGRLAIYD